MNKKIQKLNINLFKPEFAGKDIYEKKKNEFVASYEVYERGHSTGIFGFGWKEGKSVRRPDLGLAEWNKLFPGGYNEWAGDQRKLNAYGEQQVIDKVNELVERFNKNK